MNGVGMDAQNSSAAAAAGHVVQNGARKDLHLKMASADAEAGQVADAAAGDAAPLSPGGSSEAASDSQPLSPADAGRNIAVDYMKTRYQGGEKVKKDQFIVPKVVREPRKLDFQWDKVVDEKLKRSEPSGPMIREQDLIGLMLTCAGLDSGKSQYMNIVETSGQEFAPVNREPIEKVAPPEITKKVRNMFETGKLTDIHESSTTSSSKTDKDETYEILPGSGVFENEPVRMEGVVRESDFNEESEGVQRGTTKNLLDHWKTKMTTDDVKVSPNRPVFVTETEGQVVESSPVARDDVVREEDLDWDAAHIEKGQTKSLLSQWSNIGSAEYKSPKRKINVADAEGKVLESRPVRRNDVIREDDVAAEGEQVQKGTTRGLLSQWSVKGTEEQRTERKPIRIAEGEGRVAENDPVRRKDVVREEDVNVEAEQVEKGITKSLLNQWNSKDKEVFSAERRVINLAEDEGSVVESQPIRRDDVVRATDADDLETVQKGTTKSLLAQWKTKGTDDYKPGAKKPINMAEAEGKVLENEPVQRSDVIREGDVVVEGEQVQRGSTRSLLNQWQNKREEFKKDKTPIIVAESDGSVVENEPTRREDVVRENDEAEGERIQRGTTKALLNQWQNKRDDFRKEKTPIILAEAEGSIAENEPVKRTDVVREEDFYAEGEVVQRGTTKSLLNQWKVKGKQEFVTERKPIDIAEGEGSVAENEPVQRSADVVHGYDNVEDEQVQKGILKSLREQWKKKGSEEFKAVKRNIVIAEDDGTVAENQPSPRNDVFRENDNNFETVAVQKGQTRNLLGQWKSKGSEEFKGPKREIILAEDEGTVAENQPSPRNDVFRENDNNYETVEVQKGQTRNLLGQWKSKGNEQFKGPKREIILAEDEGTVAENQPSPRNDVFRENDNNFETVEVQKGQTRNLLGQWKNKGNEQFKGPKREIILAEDEGTVAENQPSPRNDVFRENDNNFETVAVQKGQTRNLLGQWKNKGNEQFKGPKREIILAEDEGTVAENQPSPRNDVFRENDNNFETVEVQKGQTRNLLGQWKNKGNEQFKGPKREIILAEDEGTVAENQPSPRNDVFRENDNNFETVEVQKGQTRNLLGQWKNKGNEQFKGPKREIILAEDEGTVAENQPSPRNDVFRENDNNFETVEVQKGQTRNLLGQWKSKGSEEFRIPKREIKIAEDEGTVAENQPSPRNDVFRENDNNFETVAVQKGQTRNLLGQWKNKGNEEFKGPKRDIILAEDEGTVAENQPLQRDDVVREYDANLEGEKIQKGYTKSLLGQWKNKGNEEFRAPKREIILAGDEGKIAENDPVQRSDVTREYDENTEEDKIQKGYTKNLLGQWKNKGNEEFKAVKREIVLAEDEGKIAENEPVQRSDVYREYDENLEGEKIQRGTTKNLLGQWKNKGNEEFKAVKKEIVLAEDEGKVAENQPLQRNDVVREYDDNLEGEKIQKGYTKNLLGQWKNKGNEEFKAPKKDIAWAEDEGKIAENNPQQRSDVTREYDENLEGEQVQKGSTRNLLGHWKNKGNEEFKAPKKEIVLAEDEGKVAENDPVQRSDVYREYDENLEGERIQRGTTKNLLGQWKAKGNEEFKSQKREIVLAEDEGKIAENEPEQRTDVTREYDESVEGDKIQKGYTKNLLGHWKDKGNEEFKAPRKDIAWAEDEGKIVENQPIQRNDVVREDDWDLEGEKIQKGYTKDLLGQWKNKGNEEFKAVKKEIAWAEDEGKIAENEPEQRSDVYREYDENLEGEKIQRGTTKNLLGQWKNKGNEEFKAVKREIVLAEDEGKIVENQPLQRNDVVRENDDNLEGEKIQKGYTKNLLGQWKDKGNEEFKAPKIEIAWAEDEGKIAENNPQQRSDVTREYDENLEGEQVQKGSTRNLLGHWKNKGNEEFKAERKDIAWAEDEGKIVENNPVQRDDVVREYDMNMEGEQVQRGMTKSLLGQWKTKGSEEYQGPKREIVLAEDEGKVAENNPVQRSDVYREYDENVEGEKIQRGTTSNLLGHWKAKGNEEFQAERKEIAWAEDEGKIAENQPIQRDDVVREDDMNMEGEQVQRGMTKSLLGQWKTKGSEEFQGPKREIVLAEDEGKVAENNPVQRSDVYREYDENLEGEKIQRGTTKNLLGQWKAKGNEEFQAERKDIAWAEDEGKIVENQPIQRNDVVREDDMNMEGEQVQRGMTKSLLGQWKTKGSEEFQGPKREIVLAEDAGRIVENEPLRRDDVVREDDEIIEGERIQRGSTRNLLGHWKDKGNERFSPVKREIVLAEDEGMVAENNPVQRNDVTRETDNDPRRELPQRGQAQNLKVQWMSSREASPRERTPVNVMENENEPSIVENDPVQRDDVVREGDNFEEVFLKRGFARDLAGYFQDRKDDGPSKEPFRLEMDVNMDENSVHENQPIELEGVTRYTDSQDEVMGKRGLIQMVSRQYLEPADRPSPRSRDQINMDLAEGPAILENDPVPVGPDVVRSDYSSNDDTSVTAGLTKNLVERWKYQSVDSPSPRTPSSLVDGKPAWVVEMEEAPGSGVFENQPEVRTDVTREVDYEPEMIPIKQTRNTRRMWSQMELEEDNMDADSELVPELVRFTPPRELTPPPIHQEDFKSYQSLTLSAGGPSSSTTGPTSPPSQQQPQPNWCPSIVGPPKPPQNQSWRSSSSSKKSTSSGPQQSKWSTGAAYRMQPQSPQGSNAAYRQNPPAMGASYNTAPPPPETTMTSSAVLVLRPS